MARRLTTPPIWAKRNRPPATDAWSSQIGMPQRQYQVTFSCSSGVSQQWIVRLTQGAEGRSNMAVLKRREHKQPAETEVEAEIREFVRRDVVTNRECQPENESVNGVDQDHRRKPDAV